jgi:hypothetical protein
MAAALPFIVSPGHALADVNGHFELDGNVVDDPATTPPDWGAPTPPPADNNTIFTLDNTGNAVPNPSLPANFLSAGFSKDFTPGATSDNSTYTNGSKDTLNISSGWACVSSNNVTDKGDIQNAYAAAYLDTSFTPSHLILYFGLEKNAPNGDNNMGVWFLRDGSVGCNNPNGGAGLPFTGNHQDGDIFLVAAFTSGGSTPTVNAYRWNGGAGGSLGTTALATGGKCGAAASDLCAIANDTNSVTTPWQTQNKASSTPQNKTGLGNTLSSDQFFEGGIDLTANHLDKDATGNTICVNRFLFDTRSSATLGSTLFDFTAGNVSTCAKPTITTNVFKQNTPAPDTSLVPPSNTVTLPAQVYDTASLAGTLGTPTGTVTYSLWTDNKCTVAATAPNFPGDGNTATVTLNANGTVPNSPALTFDTPGNFWWQATYNGDARNQAATSDCTTEPLVVQKVQPTIATTPNPTTLTIGGTPPASFNDTATISNGYFPSGGIAPGTVTFTLYGPFSTAAAVSCSGNAAFVSANVAASRVDNTTASATSASFTPIAIGVYQWVASYSGNAQNQGASTLCNDATEQVTVSPATPTVASTILLGDKAKVTGVSGAGAISGSVQFQLFPSANCTGNVLHDETVTLAADGTAVTTSDTLVNAAGTYSWQVTFTPTAGSNYTGASTSCSPASDEQAGITYGGTSPIS